VGWGVQMSDRSPANEPPAESVKSNERHSEPGGREKLLSRKAVLGWIAALVIAIVGSVVGVEAPGWFSGRPTTSTLSLVFQPWSGGKVASDLHVAFRVTGTCWEPSLDAYRQGAFRCTAAIPGVAQSGILDPCFGGYYGSADNEVICTYPSPESVTVVRLSQPLPADSAPSSLVSPWLLVLADGENCWEITGATIQVEGMSQTYQCNGGDNRLFGSINRAGRTWTILQQPNGSSDITQAVIAKAYF
jgi:hypothetical protein